MAFSFPLVIWSTVHWIDLSPNSVMIGDFDQRRRASLSGATLQVRERQVRQPDLLTRVAQGEVQRQAAEYVIAATRPGDEDALRGGEFAEEGDLEHGSAPWFGIGRILRGEGEAAQREAAIR